MFIKNEAVSLIVAKTRKSSMLNCGKTPTRFKYEKYIFQNYLMLHLDKNALCQRTHKSVQLQTVARFIFAICPHKFYTQFIPVS